VLFNVHSIVTDGLFVRHPKMLEGQGVHFDPDISLLQVVGMQDLGGHFPGTYVAWDYRYAFPRLPDQNS
jgi:acyl-CoA hydrolase